jgi:hypothetical protein
LSKICGKNFKQDHAVAASHHHATLIDDELAHHFPGRNSTISPCQPYFGTPWRPESEHLQQQTAAGGI